MAKALESALCDMQGQLFELGLAAKYDSEVFVRTFMTSDIANDLDADFNHLQWAGKEYILERMQNEHADILTKTNALGDKETLYWMGYLYRFWHYLTGESSKAIYKQAPYQTMQTVFYAYHTLSPEMAIERIKDSHN